MKSKIIRVLIVLVCVVGFYTAICIKDPNNTQVLINLMASIITIAGIIGIVELFSSFVEGFIIHHNE